MDQRADLSTLRQRSRVNLNYDSTLAEAAAQFYSGEDSDEVMDILDEMVMGLAIREYGFEEALKDQRFSYKQRVFPVAMAATVARSIGDHNLVKLIHQAVGRTIAEAQIPLDVNRPILLLESYQTSAHVDPEESIARQIIGSVGDMDKVYDKTVKRSLARSSPIDFEVIKEVYSRIRKNLGGAFNLKDLGSEEKVLAVLEQMFPGPDHAKIQPYLRRMFWVTPHQSRINDAFGKRVEWHLFRPREELTRDALIGLTKEIGGVSGGNLLSNIDYQRLADLAIGMAGTLLDRCGGVGLLDGNYQEAFEEFGERRCKALDVYLTVGRLDTIGFNGMFDF